MNNGNLKEVIKLRHILHQHPELSMEETWTKNCLMNYIRDHTELEIYDRGRWFYAIYRSLGDGRDGQNRKNIAFRGDFDAIRMDEGIDLPYGSGNPGVAHKCGHDGHSAALAGLALEVDQEGADHNVFFLFQHAEETAEGAAECVEFIKEEKIDEIFAFHNKSGMEKGSVNVIDGTSNYASVGMIISMQGSSTHASMPEYGKNPAYAIARTIGGLDHAVKEAKSRGLVLCTVIQVDIGEKAFGIAASKGDLLLTLRAEFEEEMETLVEHVENLAKSEGEADGLEVTFTCQDRFPVTANHQESSDKIRRVAGKKGYQVIEMKEGFRGSEDFGHYLKETKGALFYLGNGEDYPQIHTTEYDFPDDLIEIAVEMFKGLIDEQSIKG